MAFGDASSCHGRPLHLLFHTRMLQIVRSGTNDQFEAFHNSEVAIHAETGEGGQARILRKRTVMKLLIASIFALTLLGAGAADAAIVGVHVGGIGVGIGGHGHHHYHRHHYRHYR
jgi:hypothetical protein